jgi:glutathione synthase/RimK-type ligase-like ATP-grasp enzyme
MPRVLLLATTTGYQTRSFGEAAERLGVDLVFATNRCDVLEDPWRDGAIPIRFNDEHGSVDAILVGHHTRPIDGVLVVGDRPTVIAARALEALGLPGHSPNAAAAARNKLRSRERLRDAGLPMPWFVPTMIDGDPHEVARSVGYPCVIKPLALSASRGVMRANDSEELIAASFRLRALLRSADVRVEQDEAHEMALVEGFIPGPEYAIEGLLHHGALTVLAVFDKPDPLDGPFFEETIYVTPSVAPAAIQEAIVSTTARAARALGLRHGPIHAECRVNGEGVFMLEVAARPIGGLCARALRFERAWTREAGLIPLEELLLRHALGEPADEWVRERRASGVMMIPIPRRGVFRRVEGLEEARGVAGIDDLRITAKTDQRLVPLPEGASYLGFIFAHGDSPADVERALRAAHGRLDFVIDQEIPVLAGRADPVQSPHG